MVKNISCQKPEVIWGGEPVEEDQQGCKEEDEHKEQKQVQLPHLID